MKIKHLVSAETMEAEFLKAEWYLNFFDPVRQKFDVIVNEPDVLNSSHNQIRKRLLRELRSPLLDRIPSNTVWYSAELEGSDFGEILIVREATWAPIFGNNKKLKDVARIIFLNKAKNDDPHIKKIKVFKDRIGAHDFKGKIIVITSDLAGPYSIFEGNHRAVAFQLKADDSGDRSHLPNEIIVGHSPQMNTSPWLNTL